jgi:hypothetical protein
MSKGALDVECQRTREQYARNYSESCFWTLHPPSGSVSTLSRLGIHGRVQEGDINVARIQILKLFGAMVLA